MPVELRPTWCVQGASRPDGLSLGPWQVDGAPAEEFDGDDWTPGQVVRATRVVEIADGVDAFRRWLGLPSGTRLGLGVRWYCQATSHAGTHVSGPSPLPLAESFEVAVELPAEVAGSVAVETALLLGSVDRRTAGGPDGGVIWADTWTNEDATVQLEGDEHRIPVLRVSFGKRYEDASSALWTIEVDHGAESDDVLSAVCSVVLNEDVLARDFADRLGAIDENRLSDAQVAEIRADVIRTVCRTIDHELDELDPDDHLPGTVGDIIGGQLVECFGSTATAARELRDDPASFDRRLRSHLSPMRWDR
jgi:hypothetical protein